MSALDHLEGVAKRHIHNQSNEHAAEKGLLKVGDINSKKLTKLKFLRPKKFVVKIINYLMIFLIFLLCHCFTDTIEYCRGGDSC